MLYAARGEVRGQTCKDLMSSASQDANALTAVLAAQTNTFFKYTELDAFVFNSRRSVNCRDSANRCMIGLDHDLVCKSSMHTEVQRSFALHYKLHRAQPFAPPFGG